MVGLISLTWTFNSKFLLLWHEDPIGVRGQVDKPKEKGPYKSRFTPFSPWL